jgi:hypothetical protein
MHAREEMAIRAAVPGSATNRALEPVIDFGWCFLAMPERSPGL